jgi:hypothetical protein
MTDVEFSLSAQNFVSILVATLESMPSEFREPLRKTLLPFIGLFNAIATTQLLEQRVYVYLRSNYSASYSPP